MLLRTSLIIALIASPAVAGEMVFGFKNPSFSGEGWSSHTLTIENQEFSRKKAIDAQKKAEADTLAAAASNTNLNKFMNNLESRIYAQLSLQLSNAMFADGASTGTVDFQGSTITWIKDTTAGTINLTIIDEKGSRTDITVPMGSFKF
jgi:hypothetical protein